MFYVAPLSPHSTPNNPPHFQHSITTIQLLKLFFVLALRA